MKPFYLTTAIAYTNAEPHIGFALELVYADVLARYVPMTGRPVKFLTGTDEHGRRLRTRRMKSRKTPKCL